MAVQVLIVEDHQLMRHGIRSVLESEEGFEVAGEAKDGAEGVRMAMGLKPDVILMDVRMPVMDGIEATRRIMHDLPRTRIIALSVSSEEEFIRETLRAGAVGFLSKDCLSDELLKAIRTVLAGGRYLSGQITGVVIDSFVNRHPSGGTGKLTVQEEEVMEMTALGMDAKTVAKQLGIATSTVYTHRRNIMRKLSIPTFTQFFQHPSIIRIVDAKQQKKT